MAAIKQYLAPALKEMGFSRRRQFWKRVREPFIDCVGIQTRSDNAACCVNLGEHLTFLPIAGGSAMPHTETMRPVDCEIRKRLAPGEDVDHWWKFDNAAAEVANLIRSVQTDGEAFFAKYRRFPTPFTDLKMAEIDTDRAFELLPMMTKTRRILLIARVYDHLGDGGRAVAWAEFGMANVGMGVGPKVAFREIVKKYR